MTTYYVDAEAGDDSGPGDRPDRPWRSVGRTKDAPLRPGDQLLFRRGRTWRERLQLKASGTAEAPIVVGAYGTGPAPLFSGAIDLTGADWRPMDGGRAALDLEDEPGQLFFDDRPGRRVGEVAAVDGPGLWAWRSGRLVAYRPGRAPDIRIEACIEGQGPIWNSRVDHIRYEGLAVTRGRTVGMRVSGSRGIDLVGMEAFENCEDGIRITEDSGFCRILGGRSHHNGVATDQPSGHGYILVGGAHDVTMEDAESFANAQDGLQMGGSCGSRNRIERVRSHDNGYSGFNLKSGAGHVLRFVDSHDNDRYGLMVQIRIEGLEVTDSRFVDNSRGGSFACLKMENGVSLTSKRNLWGPIGGKGALVHSDGPEVRASFESDIFWTGPTSDLFVSFWGEAGTAFTFRHCTFSAERGNGVMWFEAGVGTVTLERSILRHADGRLIRYEKGTRIVADDNLLHRATDGIAVMVDGAARPRLAVADIAAGRLAGGLGQNPTNRFADPALRDPASGDMRPTLAAAVRSANGRAGRFTLSLDHRRVPFGPSPTVGAVAVHDGQASLAAALTGDGETVCESRLYATPLRPEDLIRATRRG